MTGRNGKKTEGRIITLRLSDDEAQLIDECAAAEFRTPPNFVKALVLGWVRDQLAERAAAEEPEEVPA